MNKNTGPTLSPIYTCNIWWIFSETGQCVYRVSLGHRFFDRNLKKTYFLPSSVNESDFVIRENLNFTNFYEVTVNCQK